jgi:hypothetical protein
MAFDLSLKTAKAPALGAAPSSGLIATESKKVKANWAFHAG